MGSCKIDCKGGRTRQDEAKETDVNRIVARFQKTGQLPLSARVGQFIDITKVVDLQCAHDTFIKAKNLFDSLPIVVRKGCNYDFRNFESYINDEKNKAQLIELGFIKEAPAVSVPKAGDEVEAKK